VEHLKAIILFKEMFIIIDMAMKEIQEHPDSDCKSSSKVYSSLSAIERYSFVAAMVTVSKVFSLSHNLSTSLQSETIDLVYFLKHSDDLRSKVSDMRERSEAVSSTFY
jgi:hypothetical protein